MPAKNLWGNLDDLEIVRTPKQILAEQAQVLTDATRGTLAGVVAENEHKARANGRAFAYDLAVVVPAMNNYTYTILSVTHNIDLYPVRVIYNRSANDCVGEEQFASVLEEILSSEEVKMILSRLLSQAR